MARTSAPAASGAPVTVKLAGSEYRISPLRYQDLGELTRWLQQRVISAARDSIKPDDPQTLKAITMEAAMKTAATLTLESPQGVAMLATVEGGTRLLWHSLKREHPDLTHEQVMELVADPSNYERALDAFDLAEGLTMRTKGANGASKKKNVRGRKSRRKKTRSR